MQLPPLVRGSVPAREAARQLDLIEREEPGPFLAARVALARKVLTLVYYGLRDGEIRCLAKAA